MATLEVLRDPKWRRVAVARLLGPVRAAVARAGTFGTASSGQIAVVFALTVTATVLATGGGIDLARGYQVKQKLSQVAMLACQYASRSSIIETIAPSYTGTNGAATYRTNVQNYINTALAAQKLGATQQTNANPFTFTVGGPADVNLTASVPTTLMQMARVTQIPVSASAHCYDDSAAIPPPATKGFLVRESFEAGCSNCVSYTRPDGTDGTRSTPTSTTSTTPTYTGAYGNVWYATGYCLERDPVGAIKPTVPDGTSSAELDCENGGNNAGNTSLSTKVYMPAGNFELRYFYTSRVNYPNYNPTYLCGSTAADLSWANDRNSSGGPVANAFRTNQMNVYLDVNTTGSPPLHPTLDGFQQLAGANLIDMCVYAAGWVERSVRIVVTTPGDYWLSFAADGQNDSFGAQLDHVRLCENTCPGGLQDNFPSAWIPTNGTNKVLFEDTFESPTYPEDSPKHGISKGGNLNPSVSISDASYGWPKQALAAWATAPYNQVNMGIKGAAEGNQHILLDGWQSDASLPRNRAISRPFLLVPGYYRIDYNYMSIVDFASSGNSMAYGTYCRYPPFSGQVFPYAAQAVNGVVRYYNTKTTDTSTNLVGLFMSHSMMVSTPVTSSTANATTTFINPPDGSHADPWASATATKPADTVNWYNYDPTAYNPVLDVCAYVDTYRWVARQAPFLIQKSGIYWLTFSANGGTGDGDGGAIDDVRLVVLGSPYMASPPSTAVTIPVPPGQQASARLSFNGFYIIANPLKAPAPLQ